MLLGFRECQRWEAAPFAPIRFQPEMTPATRAAVDHVWGGNIPAESWVDVDLGVDLDLDFIALRSNGFAVIMIMFLLNCLVGIAAIPWLNVTKPQTRRQQNGDILVIFGDIGPNLEQES